MGGLSQKNAKNHKMMHGLLQKDFSQRMPRMLLCRLWCFRFHALHLPPDTQRQQKQIEMALLLQMPVFSSISANAFISTSSLPRAPSLMFSRRFSNIEIKMVLLNLPLLKVQVVYADTAEQMMLS